MNAKEIRDLIQSNNPEDFRHRDMPIDLPDCNRDTLAELFAEMGYKEGVEVGVESGVYSESICKANPGVKLHCVDSWIGYRGYKEGDKNMDKNYAECVQRLKPYDVKIWVLASDIAAAQFADESLDFIYIDANHDLPHVIEDIMCWLPKLKKGGIIAGHDYRKIRHFKVRGKKVRNQSHHVVEAVTAWTNAYDVRPWYILGRKEKLEGEKRDKNRSWFWIKQF